MSEIYFAYSPPDRHLAESLPQNFPTRQAVQISVERTAGSQPLIDALPPSAETLFLLLTNNFLLDADGAFQLSELLAKVPQTIVIEARAGADLRDESGHYAIMADWQQRYLQLRADVLHYEGSALEDFRVHLDRVRQISLALPATMDQLARQPTILLRDLLAGTDSFQRVADQYGFTTTAMNPERPTPTPRPPDEIIAHAWTLCDAGDITEGLATLLEAVNHTPESADLDFQYILMLALEAGDLDAARSRLDQLLNHHPHHHDALFLSGELYEGEGKVAGARVQWDRLSDLRPDYPKLDERLANLIHRHFPENAQEAAAHFKKAVKLPDTEAVTHVAYARLLCGPLSKKRKARKQFRKAIQKDPASAVAHYELAVLEHGAGKNVRAKKNYLLAATLEPIYDTPANRKAFYGSNEDSVDRDTGHDTSLVELRAHIDRLEDRLSTLQQKDAAAKSAHPALTVLISGASSGIGRATARVLALSGHRLILLGRRQERLDEVKDELFTAHGTEVHLLNLDIRDRTAVFTAMEELPQNWSTIDVLLNNAGKAKGFDPIQSGDVDHWEEMIDVNLKGLLYLTRAVTPGMVDRGTGMVVNVASTAAKEVYPNGNVYCATKHAVDALTYAMRLDLVSHGIRVGQICPAHVEETEFAVVRFDGDKERAKIYQDFQPLRSSDVAEAIRFMIEQPAHVNVMDMVIQGTQQASSTVVDRSGRQKFAPKQE